MMTNSIKKLILSIFLGLLYSCNNTNSNEVINRLNICDTIQSECDNSKKEEIDRLQKPNKFSTIKNFERELKVVSDSITFYKVTLVYDIQKNNCLDTIIKSQIINRVNQVYVVMNSEIEIKVDLERIRHIGGKSIGLYCLQKEIELKQEYLLYFKEIKEDIELGYLEEGVFDCN